MTQFKQPLIDKIFKEEKTQTRRPMKPGDFAIIDGAPGDLLRVPVYELGASKIHIVERSSRLHWQVGRTYSICPGRGKKAVGRYKLLEIKVDKDSDVRNICHQDALAEGFDCVVGFLEVWTSFYDPDMQGYDLTFGIEDTAECFMANESFWIDLTNRPDELYKGWALRFEVDSIDFNQQPIMFPDWEYEDG